jgi:hypothetical protein
VGRSFGCSARYGEKSFPGGSETDAVVFETALAAARPCQAHLKFFHVRVSAGEALRYREHASFARGRRCAVRFGS